MATVSHSATRAICGSRRRAAGPRPGSPRTPGSSSSRSSPDGQWIAFTGQYDGDEQVYVVPASGGAPPQLTFYPARGPLPPRWGWDNQVYDWTRDGKSVLFRSMMDNWNQGETRLYTVSVAGGLPVALPMPVSGAGDFSPDEKQVFVITGYGEWNPIISPDSIALSFLFASFVGIFFGLYPAWKAAMSDTIDALRYE